MREVQHFAGSQAQCRAFQLVVIDRPVLVHANRATVAAVASSEVRRGETAGGVQTCGIGEGEATGYDGFELA